MSSPSDFWYEETLRNGIAEIVSKYLSAPASLDSFGSLMTTTIAFAETLLEDVTEKQPPPRPLACKEGCSFCCSGYEVHVSPIEVLGIAEYIAGSFTREEIERLVLRALDVQEAKEAHTPDETPRTRFTCPLLENDRCRIHPFRPFTCRGVNAFDAKACEASARDDTAGLTVEGYVHPYRVNLGVLKGIQQALRQTSFDDRPLDLTPALLISLTTPDIREKWLAGEPVFEQARAKLGA
jgi:Fe-S-cluster containining protein